MMQWFVLAIGFGFLTWAAAYGVVCWWMTNHYDIDDWKEFD